MFHRRPATHPGSAQAGVGGPSSRAARKLVLACARMLSRGGLWAVGAVVVRGAAVAGARPPLRRESKAAASKSAAPVVQRLVTPTPPPVYGQPTLYGAALHVGSASLKVVAEDAAGALGKMTGHAFAIAEGPAESGIVLARTDAAGLLPREATGLSGRGPQA